jgi:hypothetical protein
MFDIIFKKSVLNIDCFTNNPSIFEFSPITLANKNFPSWWKKTEKSFNYENVNSGIVHDVPTIKTCDGLLNLYSEGIMIPLWSDLIVETNSSGEWRYQYSSDENGPLVSHDKMQLGNNFGNAIHIKIISPWMIQEKTGVKFLFTGAVWNYKDQMFDLNIVPGCMEFAKQHSTHINFFVPKRNSRLELSGKQPLVHLIPLTEKKIVVHNHLISDEEFSKKLLKYSYMSSFTGRYKKNVKQS